MTPPYRQASSSAPLPARASGRTRSHRRSVDDDPIGACSRALSAVSCESIATGSMSGHRHGTSGDDEQATAVAAGIAAGASLPQRGVSDMGALFRAHHDATLHQRHAPPEPIARRLFDALERERIEALGANLWAGVRRNLEVMREDGVAVGQDRASERSVTSSGAGETDASVAGAEAALARVMNALVRSVRESLARDAIAPARATPMAMSDIGERIAAFVREVDLELVAAMNDQASYADVTLALIRRLGLQSAPGADDGEVIDGDSEDGVALVADGDADAAHDDELLDDESASLVLDASESSDADDDASAASGESEREDDVTAPVSPAEDEPPIAGIDPRPGAAISGGGYRIWTRAHDEVVDARELADALTLAERRAELDHHLLRQGRLVRRLATRLQRVLLARQRREWQFDLDEGHLDTRRLPRLLTDPLVPLVFKDQVDSAFRNTTVTLLIDNSRSMIGRPIMIAAACADILARTLERCGVGVEVLGFTTVALHGGRSEEDWKAAGSPGEPGRLNDLRHIIYKSADSPYRSARRQLALMLDRDILKQNIDGEALQWAASRLLRRPEKRRILLVISDGAPVDTATLTNNPRDYLDRHLDTVVADIERRGLIEVTAIGIGHDVARFYSQAMSVFDARELGPALLTRLELLFRRDA